MANGRGNHPMYQNNSDSYGAEESPRGGHDYQSMTQQQLERRREDEMARQDEMLDQLHYGVKGLKNHAHAINDEVVEQNAMIDDIDGRMDNAQADLERGEAKARLVNAKKAKVCKLYGVIGVLVVIEILLFFVA